MLDKGHGEVHSSRVLVGEKIFFSVCVCVRIKYYIIICFNHILYMRSNRHFIFGGGGGEVIYGHVLRAKRPATTLFLRW